MTPTPNPGSADAIEHGCICPRFDNAYGRGKLGGALGEDGRPVFVTFADCPLHGAGEVAR